MTNLGSQGYERNCIKKIQAIWRGYWTRKEFKRKLRRFYRQGLGNEERRKKYVEKEITSLSNKLDQTAVHRHQQMNSFLQNVDNTLLESRQLDRLFEAMLANRLNNNNANNNTTTFMPTLSAPPVAGNINNGDSSQSSTPELNPVEYCVEAKTIWGEVHAQALARGPSDCAICMIAITLTTNANANSNNNNINANNNGKKSVLLSCSHLFHDTCITNFERFSRLEVSLVIYVVMHFLLI